MGRTACVEPQCLYKGALYLTFTLNGQEIKHFAVHGLKAYKESRDIIPPILNLASS